MDIGYIIQEAMSKLIPARMQETDLSDKTQKWLEKWSWNKDSGVRSIHDIPSDILAELNKFRPKSSVKLYRGVKAGDEHLEKVKKLKSYSYEKGYAEAIAGIGEFGDSDKPEGTVYTRTVKPEEIVVDFTKLPQKIQDQHTNEVIVFEG